MLVTVSPHLVPGADAAAVQSVDVVAALVHEATDKPVVAEHDGRHLGDVLVALVVADVAAVIHQAGHQVAPPSLLLVALLYLKVSNTWRVRGSAQDRLYLT